MPLTDFFAGLEEVPAADGMPTAYVDAAQLVEAGRALRGAGFSVLIDALPVDYLPREPRFEMVYLLLNPGGAGTAAARLRLKVRSAAPTRGCRRSARSGRRPTGPSARPSICSASCSTATPICGAS